MRWMMALSVGLLLNGATPAVAGWNSGGGELIRDETNPWFLSNTNDAEFCIKVDPRYFSVDPTTLRQTITEALGYWQAEFAAAYVGDYVQWGNERIATQNFHWGECDDRTDLVFQFGLLTEAQRDYIGDPQRLVGVAIRTDYNLRTMRGKGFIYIAPDSGPDKPDFPGMVADPWHACNGMFLKLALVHELGHVFGLQHRGTELSLMGARYPERLLTHSDQFCPRELPAYLSRRKGARYRIDGEFLVAAKRALEIPDWVTELEVKQGDGIKYIVKATLPRREVLGEITVNSGSGPVDYPVQVWFPAEQIVFPNAPRGRRAAADAAAAIMESHDLAEFKASDGKRTGLVIRISESEFIATAPSAADLSAEPGAWWALWALRGTQYHDFSLLEKVVPVEK